VDRTDPGPLASLAKELGVATLPTYVDGQGVELREGRRDPYVGLVPTSDREGAADSIACMLDLDLAALDVPLDAPWNAAHAAALDAQTLATYFGTYLKSASARAILEVAVKAIFGTGSGELSRGNIPPRRQAVALVTLPVRRQAE
jgi:monoamine oxidase